MNIQTEIKPNCVYNHHGGGKYLVLAVADESTNARKAHHAVVVYVSLTYGRIKCRDLAEFTEVIEWPDGTKRPRFVLENTGDFS